MPEATSRAALTGPALDVEAVAAAVSYTPRHVRALAREGKFPAPINADLHPKSWRWSPAVIDAYINGEWVAA